MLETVVITIAAVVLLTIVWLFTRVARLSSAAISANKTVEDLKKKIKALEAQPRNYSGPSSDEINRLVTTTVDTRLGDLVGVSGLLVNPALVEKIVDKVIVLLSNPLSQFSTQTADALAKQMAHKLTVPNDIIDRLLRNALPQLEVAVREALEDITHSDDDNNDSVYDAVHERLDAWLKEIVDDPIKREPIVAKIVEEVADRIDDVVAKEMDEYDTVDVWVRETLPGLLSSEMEKAESELRQRLVNAVIERAVDTLTP